MVVYNPNQEYNMPAKNRAPSHPGEILYKEFLEPLALTQKQFAEHLGWTYPRLNEIINMRRGVTADSALSFGEAFGMAPEFWLNLQIQWDLWQARQTHTPVKSISRNKDKNK
jgi:addiction module HigA family antidote